MEKETISFKIEPSFLQVLEDLAAQQKNASRNTVARQMVIDSLTDADRHRILDELSALKDQVENLRHVLATAVVALLVKGGKINDPREAEAWVQKALLQ